MHSSPKTHEDRAITTPSMFVSDGGAQSSERRMHPHDQTLDQTLEQCLLETQRQVYRLEEIVHRLASVASRTTLAPVGVMSLIQEGNRRLQREVDEFTLDSYAVATMVRIPSVPISLHVQR